MKTIWKFNLNVEKRNYVEMPSNSKVLDVQMQDGKITMWALCETESERITVEILIFGTGWEIEGGTENLEYLATVQNNGYVWHLFILYKTQDK